MKNQGLPRDPQELSELGVMLGKCLESAGERTVYVSQAEPCGTERRRPMFSLQVGHTDFGGGGAEKNEKVGARQLVKFLAAAF